MNINNTHWILYVIDYEKKTITLFDSAADGINKQHENIINALARWTEDESHDKDKNNIISKDDWNCDLYPTKYKDRVIPRQTNTKDCGLFVIMYCDYLSDLLPLLFSQDDMKWFRRKIFGDLLNGKLRYKY